MSEEKLPVVLLEDLPATDDAFGSHQCIARAIFQMVSTEKGGRAIALVGDWGTGKSTVVKLLEQIAHEHLGTAGESETEVFVFDAWAHEGDPLRRSFLERLITALTRRKWVNAGHWEGKLDELTKRKRMTETTSSPILTLAGSLLLCLLYLTPLALIFVAGSHSFVYKRTVLSVAVTLYFCPLIYALLHWLGSRGSRGKNRFNLLGMLLNKTVERTESEVRETPEPSSVEFQRVFRELAAEALGTRKDCRRDLVLVIDNLDRVEIYDALKLWSSMSAFIEYPSESAPEWTRRIWTLVPFDERGIKRLWERDPGSPFGEAFLAKTFQVRFNVPVPLLSDWAAFLDAQLRTAFPKHPNQDFYGISRIFYLLCAEPQPPNPRDIKGFVNQIGSTYRSHPESIPLVHHALLAALTYSGKYRGWKPGSDIPAKAQILEYIGPDCAADLAALYYNLPKDKALQAIFGPEVENCLLQGDDEGVSRLAGKPGLDHVILNVIHRDAISWANSEAFRIGRAAFACRCATGYTSGTWQEVWSKLQSAASVAGPFSALDQKSGKGLGLLIGKGDASLGESLLTNLSNTDPHGKPDERGVNAWLAGVSEVLSALIVGEREQDVMTLFALGKTPADYLAFLNFSRRPDSPIDTVKYLRPACAPAAIMAELANVIGGNGFAANELSVENMMTVPVTWDWKNVLTAAANRIQHVNAQADDVGAIIRTLFRLSTTQQEAGNILSVLAQSGWLFHYLAVTQGTNFHTATASCLLAVIVYQPDANSPSNPGAAGQGRNIYRTYLNSPHQKPEVLESLATLAKTLVPIKRLIEISASSSVARGIIREILAMIAQGSDAPDVFNASIVADYSEFLRSEIGDDALRRVQNELIRSGLLGAELAARPFASNLINLYRVVLRAPNVGDFREHILSALRRIGKEDWLQAMRDDSPTIGLLEELGGSNGAVELDFKFRDALTEFADQTAAGIMPKIPPERCDILVSILNTDQRETIQRHLARSVAEARSSLHLLVSHFGKVLDDCTFLSDMSEDFVREGLPKMLERSEQAEIDWAARILTTCPQILQRGSRASLRILRERVEAKLNENPPDALGKSVRTLAAALRMPVTES